MYQFINVYFQSLLVLKHPIFYTFCHFPQIIYLLCCYGDCSITGSCIRTETGKTVLRNPFGKILQQAADVFILSLNVINSITTHMLTSSARKVVSVRLLVLWHRQFSARSCLVLSNFIRLMPSGTMTFKCLSNSVL